MKNKELSIIVHTIVIQLCHCVCGWVGPKKRKQRKDALLWMVVPGACVLPKHTAEVAF